MKMTTLASKEFDRVLGEISELLSLPVDCSNPRLVNEYLNTLNPLLVDLTMLKGSTEARLAKAQMKAIRSVEIKSDDWTKVKNSSTLVLAFANSTDEANLELDRLTRIIATEKLSEKISREIITMLSSFKNK